MDLTNDGLSFQRLPTWKWNICERGRHHWMVNLLLIIKCVPKRPEGRLSTDQDQIGQKGHLRVEDSTEMESLPYT